LTCVILPVTLSCRQVISHQLDSSHTFLEMTEYELPEPPSCITWVGSNILLGELRPTAAATAAAAATLVADLAAAAEAAEAASAAAAQAAASPRWAATYCSVTCGERQQQQQQHWWLTWQLQQKQHWQQQHRQLHHLGGQ
jgi:hypothetical protein